MGSLVFLSEQEIERLTGRKRPSAQIRWLKDHGYKMDVNGLGQPIVATEEANRKLLGAAVPRKKEPNWSALNGKAT